jgi:hypothetical protein
MSHLIEPELKNLCLKNLTECKEKKLLYYSRVMNIGLFVLFVVVVGVILYVRKKRKIDPVKKRAKMEADRFYILNKIKALQNDRYQLMNGLVAPS